MCHLIVNVMSLTADNNCADDATVERYILYTAAASCWVVPVWRRLGPSIAASLCSLDQRDCHICMLMYGIADDTEDNYRPSSSALYTNTPSSS